jgi:peptide-methionine (R)-S-oxide reductase
MVLRPSITKCGVRYPFHTKNKVVGTIVAMRRTSNKQSKLNSTPTTDDDNNNNKPDQPDNNELGIVRTTWNPFRLAILRLGWTEPAMVSPFNYGTNYDGTFHCAYCQHPLLDSNAKYDSGTGWPSFWRTISDASISYQREWDGRMECRCFRCKSHLGHVFLDGPRPSQVNAELLRTAPNTDPRPRSTRTSNNNDTDTTEINRSNPLPRFCLNGGALTYQPRKHQQQQP